jgi:Flp pilus assembly protein TadD
MGSALAQAVQDSATTGPVRAAAVSPAVSSVTTAAAPQPVATPEPVMAPTPAASPIIATRPPATGHSEIPGRVQRTAPSAIQQADAQQYIQQGRQMIQKDQFGEALGSLDRAVDTDPWSAPAYNLRGYAHLRLRQFDQAVADCTEAIRLQPSFLNAYENRSSARRHQGDRAGAQEDALKVADLLAGPQKPAAANSSLSAKR